MNNVKFYSSKSRPTGYLSSAMFKHSYIPVHIIKTAKTVLEERWITFILSSLNVQTYVFTYFPRIHMLVRITTQCRVIEQNYFSTVGSTHYQTKTDLSSCNVAYTMTLWTPWRCVWHSEDRASWYILIIKANEESLKMVC